MSKLPPSGINPDGTINIDYIEADLDDFEICVSRVEHGRARIRLQTAVGWLSMALKELRAARSLVVGSSSDEIPNNDSLTMLVTKDLWQMMIRHEGADAARINDLQNELAAERRRYTELLDRVRIVTRAWVDQNGVSADAIDGLAEHVGDRK